MSLACCYTDDETPYCSNRRHERLAMCLKHTREEMRVAILDGGVPWDALKELAKFTDWAIDVKKTSNRWADMQQTIDIKAEINDDHELRKVLEREQSIVYYIQLTGNRVKIGYTTNMVRRMTALRVRIADVLATEPGGYQLETARHRQFGYLREGRLENFDAQPALMAHIAATLEINGPPHITTDVL